MLHQILDADWLSELSDEQQEIVTGGGQLDDLSKQVMTAFDASTTMFKNTVTSGPTGSYVTTEIANTAVFTTAQEMLDTAFNGHPILNGGPA